MVLDVTIIVINKLEFYHKAACCRGMAHRSWHQRDLESNTCFPSYWLYDFGETNPLSLVSPLIKWDQ